MFATKHHIAGVHCIGDKQRPIKSLLPAKILLLLIEVDWYSTEWAGRERGDAIAPVLLSPFYENFSRAVVLQPDCQATCCDVKVNLVALQLKLKLNPPIPFFPVSTEASMRTS